MVASICVSVCVSKLSYLNQLTFDLDFWHEGGPWPDWADFLGQRSWSNAGNGVWTSLFIANDPAERSGLVGVRVNVNFKVLGQIHDVMSILGAQLVKCSKRQLPLNLEI